MDFRNPPGQYDPDVHQKRHEEELEKRLSGSFRGLLWNTVNLLIAVGAIVLIIFLIKLF
ncbi:hypothetical protein GRF59_08655 [Paenibacillus sp. HJL G12]|uniref:Uncharacterized protein n=1 Tax=Paenibacillus dendrobii TaxID=2691084 RepID=A0A7X3IHR5_9BACL|nr:hypothetical protein [Paenibacillus dendrobii]